MQVRAMLAAAPREVTVPGSGQRFALADDLVADHRRDSQAPDVRLVAGEETAGAAGRGPVYRRVPDGVLVVPTGLVLVRFVDSVSAESRRDTFPGAGYVLEHLLPYAPHAAWVQAQSADIGDALRDMSRLAALAGVVSVEPQMIGERAGRR